MKINKMIVKDFPSYSFDGVYYGVNRPKRITFHNTAGGTSAKAFANSEQTAAGYSAGIPHYYVDKSEIWQVLNEDTVSYANGNYEANDGAVTIEIVDGYKNIEDFKKAERLAVELAKDIIKRNKIKITESNFRLHREYTSTSCPKKSADLHGGTAKTKKFFMDSVKEEKIAFEVWGLDKNNYDVPLYFYSEKRKGKEVLRKQATKTKGYAPYGMNELKILETTNLNKDINLNNIYKNKDGSNKQLKKGTTIPAKFIKTIYK